ncbi:formate dehydrogenase accessory sulfurtransferase FdhD [Euzebya rosea]|uniref:formate dehydrogenase accessory sulfurtransferase FdhD n=1 Tax=Euzebya rosea TaxID=2052804 RepID=UPI000D3E1A5F|nr:formate dehydrogenase accessory sulfurtransferase FdhD [Euzebya rosea]
MAGATRRRKVRRFRDGASIGGRASLAVEEPLEIRVDGDVVATTMRTPGHDFDLALGFAITDGGVSPDRVGGMSYCGVDAGEVVAAPTAADLAGPYSGDFNVVNVATRDGGGVAVVRRRQTVVTSACGVCGADVVADLRERAGSVAEDPLTVDADVIAGIPPAARAAQPGFEATGGMHAAASFAADGSLLALREDVGRHNAVDKVVGWAATAGRLPLAGTILFTSGRVAFEIVAKAAVAGIPMVVAVSAPTTLAVELAEEVGLTLVGFARDGDFTTYTATHRIHD